MSVSVEKTFTAYEIGTLIFELSADPFYSDANMSRLRESIRQVRDGEKELTEHEIENK